MKKIYSAQNSLMVDHLKHVLDAQGIGCVVRNRTLSMAAGDLPLPDCWTELWILDEGDWTPAEAIVAKALAEDDRAGASTWQCPRCGERIEAQFDSCWNCPTKAEDGGAPSGDAWEPKAAAPIEPWSRHVPSWLIFVLLAFCAWYVLDSYERPPF